MATVAIKIVNTKKRQTNHLMLKFALPTKRYIDTPYFVSERQSTPNFTLKDVVLIKQLDADIDDYRLTLGKLNDKLHLFTAETLRIKGNFLVWRNLQPLEGFGRMIKNPDYLGRILFDINGHWIYHGEIINGLRAGTDWGIPTGLGRRRSRLLIRSRSTTIGIYFMI